MAARSSQLAPGICGVSSHDALLEQLRPVCFAVAYRMLGSVSEAEDIVQEALLRLHLALEHGEEIQSPKAFVATLTTRLAIDELRSARMRREQYVGEWLPEPLVTNYAGDPAQRAEIAESVSIAMLVLLESLSPEQRAALLLHDVFEYDYAEIAHIIGKSEDNVRQLASRARRHVQEHRPRFHASRAQHRELAARFFAAAENGDLAGLESLLAKDVVLTGDGGGKAPALGRSLYGSDRVARTVLNWMRAGSRISGLQVRSAEMNASPGALILDADDHVVGALVLDISDGQIQRISSVVNPDKLAHLGPTGDMNALLRRKLR